ncbi:hypothetical protein GCM10019059_41990 [Camelimonas fluminis]|nr:hypothetical protein GCM10019059_41990 [Camelimonas fluminis]
MQRGEKLSHTGEFQKLKDKQRRIRGTFPEPLSLRVHRSISWIGCAESSDQNEDGRFIFLWIAFNAAYADERKLQSGPWGERSNFLEFFNSLSALDREKRIYKAIWDRFSGPVRILMANQYTFHPFWQHHNGIEGYADWNERFEAGARSFTNAFARMDTARVLSFVFDRLYVLRNQLVHGGATWAGDINRQQVRDGAAILSFLVPIFVDLMMDNPHENWGMPFYPVVSS